MSKPTYSISQVLATKEGDWINAEVYCYVHGVKPSNGKGPNTATLSDNTGTILGKFWGGSITMWEGKRVRLHGAGMQRKAYKGVPELSVSQKAEISFAGDDEIPGDPPPRAPQNAPRAPESPANNPSAVHGATACWAVGKAVEMVLKLEGGPNWADIDEYARTLLSIQQAIESGAPAEENAPPF